VLVLGVSIVLTGGTGVAVADDQAPTPSDATVVAAVEDAGATAAVAAGTDVSSTASDAIRSAAGSDESAVAVPRDPDGLVSLTSSSGDTVGIGLPLSGDASDAHVLNGTAIYQDPQQQTAVAVQPLQDGSVRALVTIADASAPSEYRFPLALPAGEVLEAEDDGSVEVVAPDGTTVAAIAPAWAKDADGKALPSAYRIEGTTLVQTVDLSAAGSFPVVADPWVQGDCGWFTCTVRFDRAATRNARDAGWLIGAAAGACAVVTGGTAAIVCGAAIAPAAVYLAVMSGRYYEGGNCLGIRVTKTFPAISWATQVHRSSYNCR
jgi:hypothetical protein